MLTDFDVSLGKLLSATPGNPHSWMEMLSIKLNEFNLKLPLSVALWAMQSHMSGQDGFHHTAAVASVV